MKRVLVVLLVFIVGCGAWVAPGFSRPDVRRGYCGDEGEFKFDVMRRDWFCFEWNASLGRWGVEGLP